MIHLSPYLLYFIVAFFSAVLCFASIPRIILLAKKKRLFDLPDHQRKVHKNVIPNLGGIGIFISFFLTVSIFLDPTLDFGWNYVLAATFILFLVGVMDDILNLSATKKFAAQIVAALITVCLADIRLYSLHGILGMYHLPDWLSISFSVVGCIFITNAFNLIDGIDGLAGTIGVLCTLALGFCLGIQGNYNAALIAFALFGSLCAFLWFNIAPARIFMGDSGSLFMGFNIAVLCITFINSFQEENQLLTSFIYDSKGALLFALAVLFIPVFDSFRVFLTRIAKGRHPFRADRTHLHHFLLDLGFSHSRTVTILITANLLIIAVALLVQGYNANVGLASILVLSFSLFTILYGMRQARLRRIELMTEELKRVDSTRNMPLHFSEGHHQNSSHNIEPTVQLPTKGA